MKSWLAIFCVFVLGPALNANTVAPPDGWDDVSAAKVTPEMQNFWAPIRERWFQGLYQQERHDESLRSIDTYCRSYAIHHPPSQLQFMIADLNLHPSELRAIFYGEVVVLWGSSRVNYILGKYRDASPGEMAAANDFTADLEEAAKEGIKPIP